ncbi:MAG: hypothetical protein AAF902_10020 [Chloroflexota bacterium]
MKNLILNLRQIIVLCIFSFVAIGCELQSDDTSGLDIEEQATGDVVIDSLSLTATDLPILEPSPIAEPTQTSTPTLAPTILPTPTPSMKNVLNGVFPTSHIGGASTAFEIQGNRAYVGQGRRLLVVDISDTQNLKIIRASKPLPHRVAKIAITNNYAFAGGENDEGLTVLDISDGGKLDVIGSTQGSASEIRLYKNYLISVSNNIYLFDISDPTQPKALPPVNIKGTVFSDAFTIKNDRLYVSTTEGFFIYDLSEPTEPILVGNNFDVKGGRTLAVTDTHAYLTTWKSNNVNDVLHTFNVEDPTNIVLMNQQQMISTAKSDSIFSATGLFISDDDYMFIGGNSAFVAADGVTLVYRIEDGYPTKSTEFSTNGLLQNFRIISNELIGISFYDGLEVFDIENKIVPKEVSSIKFQWPTGEIEFYNDVAFASAGGSGGLAMFDITDPLEPKLQKTLFEDLVVRSMDVGPDLLFVSFSDHLQRDSSQSNGVRVFDISSLPEFQEIAFIELTNITVNKILYKDGLLYVMTQTSILVYDVQVAAEPVIFTGYYPAANIQGFGIGSDFVYAVKVLNNNYSEPIMDIFDFIEVTREDENGGEYSQIEANIVGSIALPGKLEAFESQDHFAFVSIGRNESSPPFVTAIDTSNPVTPTFTSTFRGQNDFDSLKINGSYLYMTTLDVDSVQKKHILQVLDISDVSNLKLVAEGQDSISSVSFKDDYMFVSGGLRGMDIYYWPFRNSTTLNLSPTLMPTVLPEPDYEVNASSDPELNFGPIKLISVSSNGVGANGASDWMTSISANGRFIVFGSAASNLVDNDTNSVNDVFVHDQQTGEVYQVSLAFDGSQANAKSFPSSITADGSMITFFSMASNLVEGDLNDFGDVFVFDQQTRKITLVSFAHNNSMSNEHSIESSISSDGRFIAFSSSASNLTQNDNNEVADLFLHDLQTSETILISKAFDGFQADQPSGSPAISFDGRFIAFISSASNLVRSDTNASGDIFVFNYQENTINRISLSSDGLQGNKHSVSWSPSISENGQFIAFTSTASNLVPDDGNNKGDVFVHHIESGRTTLISIATNGSQGNELSSFPSISGDGRFIVFQSEASNLVPNDTNGFKDIFLHDRQSHTTVRLSIAYDGLEANESSTLPVISQDGKYIAFTSLASNLVNNDLNGYADIFVIENPFKLD